MNCGWRKLVKLVLVLFSFYLCCLPCFSADAITPLLDNSPINVHQMFSGSFSDRVRSLKSLPPFFKMGEPNTEYYTALACTLSLQISHQVFLLVEKWQLSMNSFQLQHPR